MEFPELDPIWSLESVQQQVSRAAKRAGEVYAENIDAAMGWAAFNVRIESPLEAVFLAWWEALNGVNYWEAFRLQSQHSITIEGKTRRIDFVVQLKDPEPYAEAAALGVAYPWVAVELDGHDFHERTKAQVADRNARDRGLQAAGWTVFHFSGSELYRDPEKCLREVMDFTQARVGDFQRELFYAKRAALEAKKTTNQ